jgi:hypothetical protein
VRKMFQVFIFLVLALNSFPSFGMPFVPTDDIALVAPDQEVIKKELVKRGVLVRNFVAMHYYEFANLAELRNPELSALCPNFSALGSDQKITLFSFMLDVYIHQLPINKRMYMPFPDPKVMSQSQLEAHKLEYGDLVPLKNKEELYEFVGRFDEAQINAKARKMLQLLQKGSSSPADIHSLLSARGMNDKDPIKRLKWILNFLKFCSVKP